MGKSSTYANGDKYTENLKNMLNGNGQLIRLMVLRKSATSKTMNLLEINFKNFIHKILHIQLLQNINPSVYKN